MFTVLKSEKFQWFAFLFACIILAGCKSDAKEQPADASSLPADKTLTVYTFRNYANDEHLFRLFEQREKCNVKVVTDKSEALIQKLLQEGSTSPASLIILNDLSLVLKLKQQGALRQGDFGKLNLTIPSRYSDPQQYWIGLSKWAPALAYSTAKVNRQLIGRYADLANPKWKDKILTTGASNAVNQTLVASMLAAEGADAATTWTNGVVANLAEAPLADDYAIIKALSEGKGDIGLINASSLIQYQRSGNIETYKQAEGIGILYPVNAAGSTYFNLSIASIPAHAPNTNLANKLLNFLADQEVQKLFAETLYEYPLNPYSLPSDFLIEIGGFNEKEINFDVLGQNVDKAKGIMQSAAWKE